MYGAVLGDIIGSCYEAHTTDRYDFELFSGNSRFTDDTVLSVASAHALLADAECSLPPKYAMFYKQYYRRYPDAGYGYMFIQWGQSERLYKNSSYGNGAAMRVTPFGYAFDDLKTVEEHTKASCIYTHNHKEAINGALAVAYAVFAANKGLSKDEIKKNIEKRYKFNLDFTLEQIRPTYTFSSRTCESVPYAIKAFLESTDYESAIRNAVYLNGDSDTLAAIAGGISEAYYKKIPKSIYEKGKSYLNKSMRDIIDDFYLKNAICTVFS